MPTIACSACGAPISDPKMHCPHCGHPITINKAVNGGNADHAERVETTDSSRASFAASKPDTSERNASSQLAGTDDGTENSFFEIRNKNGAILLRVPGNTLAKANLAKQYLRGAQLTQCDLRGAILVGTDLRGADLTGSDLSNAELDDAILTDACLKGARMSGCQKQFSVERADMTGADLRDAEWAGVNARQVNLSSADLSDAKFFGVTFYGADLRGVTLDRARFTRSDLCYANVVGLDLSQADEIDVYSAKFDDGLGGMQRRWNVGELRFDRTTKWPRWTLIPLRCIYYGDVVGYAGWGMFPGIALTAGGLLAAQASPLLGALLFYGGLLLGVVGGLGFGIYRLVRDFVFEWDKQPWESFWYGQRQEDGDND